ncbi:hypothetical protein PVAND_004210 [Polypedilum vanderplanki]|uniref:Peptidase aspartic putative domain-containing protein n=1 Tax=Polypedilum vanderplanki TaxID=319348 RepID=A0A9J6BYE9_POLVA|nr:hypothetical protein PVAND_004210 [Polypedilum vanderplanki]
MMDAQQDCIQQLERNFENFKQASQTQRTTEWLQLEDEKRHVLWEKIQENHQILRVSFPPIIYSKFYSKSIQINNDFIAKLREWGYQTRFVQDIAHLSNESDGSSSDTTESGSTTIDIRSSNINPSISTSMNPITYVTTMISQPLPSTSIVSTIYQTPQMHTGTTIPINNCGDFRFTTTPFVNTGTSQPYIMTQSSQSSGNETMFSQQNNIPINVSNNSTHNQNYPSNSFSFGTPTNSNNFQNNFSSVPPVQPLFNTQQPYLQSYNMNQNYTNQAPNINPSRTYPSQNPPQHSSCCSHSPPHDDPIQKLAEAIENLGRGRIGWERSIPIFNGDLREYELFKDACDEVIGKTSLSETSKFLQLRKHLDGEALREIGSISDGTKNAYTEAWKKLDRKYKNNRTFVMWNVDTIINGGLCIKERTLEDSENEIQHTITPRKIIVETVLLQMDPKTKKRAKYHFGNLTNTPTIYQLVEFLISEENQLTPDRFIIDSKKKECLNNQKFGNNQAMGNVANQQNQQQSLQSEQNSCLICKNPDHLSIDCSFLLNADNRQSLLKAFCLCLYCGLHPYIPKRKTNDSIKCPNYGKLCCGVCQKPHHTLLHDGASKYLKNVEKRKQKAKERAAKKSGAIDSKSIQTVTDIKSSNLSLENSSKNDLFIQESNVYKQSKEAENVYTRLMALGKCQSLVPTLRIPLITSTGKELEVKVLIDYGSTKNYIRQEIINLLGLNQYDFSQDIHGIGNLTISGNKIVECTKIGKNKKLADPKIGIPEKIDLIIGTQSHYLILSDKFPVDITSDPGLTWTPTHWGWIVGGTPEFEFNKNLVIQKQRNANNINNQGMIALSKVLVQEDEIHVRKEIGENSSNFHESVCNLEIKHAEGKIIDNFENSFFITALEKKDKELNKDGFKHWFNIIKIAAIGFLLFSATLPASATLMLTSLMMNSTQLSSNFIANVNMTIAPNITSILAPEEFSAQQLKPGMYLREKTKNFVERRQISFSLDTDFNVNLNISVIKSLSIDFRSFCEEFMKNVSMLKISTDCNNFQADLYIATSKTVYRFMEIQNLVIKTQQRETNRLGGAMDKFASEIKQIMKLVAKSATASVKTIAISVHEYEIHKIRKHINKINHNGKVTVYVLKTAPNLEHDIIAEQYLESLHSQMIEL